MQSDKVSCTIKGPDSETKFDIYFARDPARTPLADQSAARDGHVLDGVGPLNSYVSRSSLPCRHRRAASPITPKLSRRKWRNAPR